MRALLTLCVLGLVAAVLAAGSSGAASAVPDSLQEQIDRAQPGDTITITSGTYSGPIRIDKALTLEGIDWPVIDGGGEGDVVTITADDVTLSGFEVRNGGQAVSQEPAAIKVVESHGATIERNRVEDARFGIYVTGSHHVIVDGNQVDLREQAIERRGHGIYFWEVSESAVHGNKVTNAGDGIHLEFSTDNGIALNTVTDSRYALHFMYSDNNRILSNSFTDNLSGAVLMYSHELLLKDNEIARSRQGATGAGILLKDVDNIFADGNTIVRNKYGLMAESSPQKVGATATFMNNVFALNDIGVGLSSNAPITFVGNAMIENTVQVTSLGGTLLANVHGGSTTSQPQGATRNTGHVGHGATIAPAPVAAPSVTGGSAVWSIGGRGNYWSDYAGYDADGDGVGDQPYRPEPAFAGALADNPTLRLFQFTLAQEALDMAADMFPVYEYSAVIEDAAPLMTPPGPALADERGINGDLLLVSVLLLGLAAAVTHFMLDLDLLGVLMNRGRRVLGKQAGGIS